MPAGIVRDDGEKASKDSLSTPDHLCAHRVCSYVIHPRSGPLQGRYQDTISIAVHIIESFPRSVYNCRMSDWSSCPAVERDPERVSGVWVFRGTRVPVTALFQNLEDGAHVSDFIDWFPGVTLAQVRAVLEHAARSLEAA